MYVPVYFRVLKYQGRVRAVDVSAFFIFIVTQILHRQQLLDFRRGFMATEASPIT